MKRRRLFLLNKWFYKLCLILVIILNAYCYFIGPLLAVGEGTTGAKTLEITPSARVFGMGDVFTGIANDISTIYFNPAGLSQLRNREVSFMYKQAIAETNINAINLGYLRTKFGKFGLSVLLFDGGVADIYFDDGSTKQIKAQRDFLSIVSFSPKILKDGAFGINFKSLNTTLAEKYSTTVFALDIGILIKSNNSSSSSFGMVMQNIDILGKGIKYIEIANRLPLNFRVGGTYKTLLLNNTTVIGIDGIKSYYGGSWKIHIGIESLLTNIFVIRIGYKYGYDLVFLSSGIGVKFGKFKIDIGTNLIGKWGSDHQASLSIEF